jgi:Na+/H+ antiporter NhaD/arsenite permease-like protein
MTEMVASVSEFVKKMAVPNFLTIGIVIIVIWLLISGLKKGLKKRGKDKNSGGNDNEE